MNRLQIKWIGAEVASKDFVTLRRKFILFLPLLGNKPLANNKAKPIAKIC